MTNIKIDTLKEAYEDACNDYIVAFCDKQDIEFDGWVGDEIGGLASFICQYFFGMDDIVLDINTKQKKGLILKWSDEGVDYHFTGGTLSINYKSYIMGLRYSDLGTIQIMKPIHGIIN